MQQISRSKDIFFSYLPVLFSAIQKFKVKKILLAKLALFTKRKSSCRTNLPEIYIFLKGFKIIVMLPALFYFMFSYSLVEPQDKSWGSADANGTWRGLVGMALYRKVSKCTT